MIVFPPACFVTDLGLYPPDVAVRDTDTANIGQNPVIAVSPGSRSAPRMQIQIYETLSSRTAPVYDSGEIAWSAEHRVPPQSTLSPLTGYAVRARLFLGTHWTAWSPHKVFASLLPRGDVRFDRPGNFTWTVPPGVGSVSIWVIGGGGGGFTGRGFVRRDRTSEIIIYSNSPGNRGGYSYGNNLPVQPGMRFNITVGSGRNSNYDDVTTSSISRSGYLLSGGKYGPGNGSSNRSDAKWPGADDKNIISVQSGRYTQRTNRHLNPDFRNRSNYTASRPRFNYWLIAYGTVANGHAWPTTSYPGLIGNPGRGAYALRHIPIDNPGWKKNVRPPTAGQSPGGGGGSGMAPGQRGGRGGHGVVYIIWGAGRSFPYRYR